MADADNIVEEEEVIYEEVPQPHVIETGDSVKVKQVLDEATVEAVTNAGCSIDYSWDNLKLLLMFIACLFALAAQFYPMPFPASRPLLAVCCAMYFVISSILQFMVTFIDKDTILFTKPNEKFPHAMKIRATFPRFQEYYTLFVQFKGAKTECTTGKMYVGKYFTGKGEFDEEAFTKDVVNHVQEFVNKNYTEIEYNHKMD